MPEAPVERRFASSGLMIVASVLVVTGILIAAVSGSPASGFIPGLVGVVLFISAFRVRYKDGATRQRLHDAAAAATISADQSAASYPSPPLQRTDLADQLRSLDELHTAGSLTDQEFAAAKSRLLEK